MPRTLQGHRWVPKEAHRCLPAPTGTQVGAQARAQVNIQHQGGHSQVSGKDTDGYPTQEDTGGHTGRDTRSRQQHREHQGRTSLGAQPRGGEAEDKREWDFTPDLPPHEADLFPGPRGCASPASASRSAPLKTCSCCSLTQPRVRRRLETKPTAAAISGTMSARGPPPRRWFWRWLMLGSRAAAARAALAPAARSHPAPSAAPAPRRP